MSRAVGTMDTNIDVDLLDRYLAGTCSARERSRVEQWLAADPARSLAGLATGVSPYPESLGDRDAAWARVQRTMHQHPAGTDAGRGVVLTEAHGSAAAYRRPRWWTVAGRQWRHGVVASTVAIAGVALFLGTRGDAPADRGLSRVYATTTGQRATLTLLDGSRVTLAPRTTLRVDAAFGASARTVALDGEAIFEVAAHRATPFIVRTGRVTTRVLGTTFSVRHYAHDPLVQVAVVQGKVVSGGRINAITLTAGMVGDVSDSVTTLHADSAARYVMWTRGQLMFHRAPATELLAALTRWYGYRFQLADSAIATQNLTAAIDVRSPTDAFATLKLLLDVDLTFDGDLVTLSPRKRSVSPQRHDRDGVSFTHQTEVGR